MDKANSKGFWTFSWKTSLKRKIPIIIIFIIVLFPSLMFEKLSLALVGLVAGSTVERLDGGVHVLDVVV